MKTITTTYFSEKDLPRIGETFTKDGKEYEVVENRVQNVSIAKLASPYVVNTAEVQEVVKPLLAEIKERCFTKDYEASDTEAMGMLLSKYFQYAGDDVLEAAYYGLEDSNFHGEAKAVLDLMNGETVIEK